MARKIRVAGFAGLPRVHVVKVFRVMGVLMMKMTGRFAKVARVAS